MDNNKCQRGVDSHQARGFRSDVWSLDGETGERVELHREHGIEVLLAA